MKKRIENKQTVNKSSYTKLINLCMRLRYEFIKVLLGDIKNIIQRETEYLAKKFLMPSDNPYEGYAFVYSKCECNEDFKFFCCVTSTDAPISGKFMDLSQRFIAASDKKKVAIELTLGKNEIYVFLPKFWKEFQKISQTTTMTDNLRWFLASKPNKFESDITKSRYIVFHKALVSPAKYIGNDIWVIDELKDAEQLNKDQLFDFVQYEDTRVEIKYNHNT